jgi:HlyD family secretion protein
MKKSWLLLLLPVLLLIGWGLSRRDPAVIIRVSPVGKTTIESIISTNGKAEPAEWAAARTLSAGIVDSISVQRGDIVSAGQPLVTLDARLIKTELEGALARRQEAQVEVSTLSQGGKAAAIASLTDSLRAAKESVASLQRNYDALQRLLPQQAATKIQVDDAKDALERAKLQVASIEHQRETLVTPSDKSAALARVNDAQSVVDQATQRLQYGVVRSPVNGTLYQFDLKKGAYLQAGDLVGLVGNLDRVKVVVYVDEPDLGRVALGMPVSISWDARPGRKWAGKVDRLPSQVIALGTRSVGEVTTIVENPNHDLLPGVTVNATIVSRVVQNATSVPKAALRSMRGESGVFKVVGDHLRWTPVKAGASDISNVEILSGVSDGDRVAEQVVEPSDAELKDGLRVKAEATP